MLEKLRHTALQRLSNRLNQFQKASEDWLEHEALYTQLHLSQIRRHLDALETKSPLEILDGGCGGGAIAVPLARDGHRITGIEIHRPSLDLAKQTSEREGVSCRWVEGDLLEQLRGQPDTHYDAGLCMGVLYTCVDWREIVHQMQRVLKPGGLFFGTFRTRSYFITALLRQGQFDKALQVTKQSEGTLRLAKLPSYYNWQTPPELRELLTGVGLELVELRPSGLFSGSGYDGMAAIADIEALSPEALRTVAEIESADHPGCEGSARFTLAIARARPGG